MGTEARTTLRIGDTSYAGTALLESDELRFRGETRLRIGLADVRAVTAVEGVLRVEHAGGVAAFALGSIAAKWAHRIEHPRTLSDKLGVKRGMRVAILGIEDESIRSQLLTSGAELVEGRVPAGTPMVILRVASAKELSAIAKHASAIARDGALWVVHPRGDPAVADTVIFAAASAAGLTYTKVVRFSETDTAEKLVIPRAAR
jgi:hypothetical protein